MNLFLNFITANALKHIAADVEIINTKETDHKLVIDFHQDTIMTCITASILQRIGDITSTKMSYTADKEIFNLPGGYKIVVDKKYKTLTATIKKSDEKDYISFVKNICMLGDVDIIDGSIKASISSIICKIDSKKPLDIKHSVRSRQENINILANYNLGYVEIVSHIGDDTIIRITM